MEFADKFGRLVQLGHFGGFGKEETWKPTRSV
jgi:hypothetical protein